VTDFLQLALLLVAAVNPAAAAAAPAPPGTLLSPRVLATGAAVALVVLALAALGSDQILDALGVEPETFRVGAGVVLAIGGGLAVFQGGSPHKGPWEGEWAAFFPLALPVLVTPAALAATIVAGADEGAGRAIAAAAIAVGIALGLLWLRAGRSESALDAIARVTGVLLVIMAAGLIVDGVQAI